MISNNELLDLIERIRAEGATVVVEQSRPDGEGRYLVETVTVAGVRGIGPYPMGPIAAAEAIRAALARIADYADRIDAKQERLEDRADRLKAEATRRFDAADLREENSGIPFGQPILVGHHSEGKHRRAIARSDMNMRKGIEASKAADDAARRAASVGSGGISSDDPLAVAKLKEELAVLEKTQERMAAANKIIRKFKGDTETNRLLALEAIGLSHGAIGRILTPDYAGRIGYPAYSLSNNSANIRRIKARITHLERTATAETKETLHNSGVRMVENVEANRLQLFFDGKPPVEVREKLKGAGFRWAPSEGAWQRHLGANAKWAAQSILEGLNA